MYSAPEGFAGADDKGRIAGVQCPRVVCIGADDKGRIAGVQYPRVFCIRAYDKGRIAGVHCTVPPSDLQEPVIGVG